MQFKSNVWPTTAMEQCDSGSNSDICNLGSARDTTESSGEK